MKTLIAPVTTEEFDDLLERFASQNVIFVHRMKGSHSERDFWINYDVSRDYFEKIALELSAEKREQQWTTPYPKDVLYIEEMVEDPEDSESEIARNRLVLHAPLCEVLE